MPESSSSGETLLETWGRYGRMVAESRYGDDMTDLVTLGRQQTPIVAVRADDPLVRSVVAYTGRMRAEAARLRDLADKYDALADNSDPTPVITPGYGSAAEAHTILLSWASVAAERGLDAWAARMLRVATDLPCGCGVRCDS